DPSLIQNLVIMTRLDVRFAPDATIGDINNALILVDGGIVSMSSGSPWVTIAIPQQSTVDALLQIADTLRSAPGILSVLLAREAEPQVLPTSVASFQDKHLLPTRFPAAWNAMQLATGGCETRKVPVFVVDNFIRPAPADRAAFTTEVPGFGILPPENG